MTHPLDTCECGHDRRIHWHSKGSKTWGACAAAPVKDHWAHPCGCRKFKRLKNDGPGGLKELLQF